jgi:hypothetical protein
METEANKDKKRDGVNKRKNDKAEQFKVGKQQLD